MSSRTSLLLVRPFMSSAGPRVPVQILMAAAVALVGGYAVVRVGNVFAIFGLLGAIGFAALGAMRPALFLGLVLLVRPLLDDLGGNHVGVLNAAGALGALTVFVLLVRILTARQQLQPVGVPAFAVVLVVSAAACVPAYLDVSRIGSKPAGEIVRLAAMLGVYVLAAQLFSTPRRLTQLFVIVGLSGVVPAILGIKELVEGTAPKPQGLTISRITGPFTGPNPFGLFLAFTALVLIALPRRALPLWVRVVALVPILTALVATYSRAGWALFLIGFLLLMWRRNPGLMGIGVVVALSLVFFVPTIHDRVLPPPKAKDAPLGGGVATPESYQFRLGNWGGLLGKWEQRPLTGYGLQSTVFVNPRQLYDPTGVADTTGYDAHNSAVKLLVEGGVALLVAWIALIAAVTLRFRGLARRDWAFKPQARAVLFLWIGAIVIGLSTDDPLAATAMMYGLFALSGALEGAYRRSPRSGAAPAAPGREAALAKRG